MMPQRSLMGFCYYLQAVLVRRTLVPYRASEDERNLKYFGVAAFLIIISYGFLLIKVFFCILLQVQKFGFENRETLIRLMMMLPTTHLLKQTRSFRQYHQYSVMVVAPLRPLLEKNRTKMRVFVGLSSGWLILPRVVELCQLKGV